MHRNNALRIVGLRLAAAAHLPSASCPLAAACSPLGAAYAERRRWEPPGVGPPLPAPPSGARLRRLMLCSDRAWRQLLPNTELNGVRMLLGQDLVVAATSVAVKHRQKALWAVNAADQMQP